MKLNPFQRCSSIWKSFLALPKWVQIWVTCLLIPVNGFSFFMLDTWTGAATAWAALFVVVTNVPLMFITSGMSKALSIPHLFAWGPLVVLLLNHWQSFAVNDRADSSEYLYLLAVLLVNGTSLVFDALDSYRWWLGDRQIPGATAEWKK